jgi:hypothetical protein
MLSPADPSQSGGGTSVPVGPSDRFHAEEATEKEAPPEIGAAHQETVSGQESKE